MKLTGKFKGLDYLIKIEASDIPVEGSFDYGDENENAKYLERFHNGELENIDILVTIFSKSGQVEGFDSLGGCHIRASHFEQDVEDTIKEYEMKQNALNHLKEVLEQVKGQDFDLIA